MANGRHGGHQGHRGGDRRGKHHNHDGQKFDEGNRGHHQRGGGGGGGRGDRGHGGRGRGRGRGEKHSNHHNHHDRHHRGDQQASGFDRGLSQLLESKQEAVHENVRELEAVEIPNTTIIALAGQLLYSDHKLRDLKSRFDRCRCGLPDYPETPKTPFTPIFTMNSNSSHPTLDQFLELVREKFIIRNLDGGVELRELLLLEPPLDDGHLALQQELVEQYPSIRTANTARLRNKCREAIPQDVTGESLSKLLYDYLNFLRTSLEQAAQQNEDIFGIRTGLEDILG